MTCNQTQNLSDRDEIAYFEQALQGFQTGAVDADRFTALRLQMGVYGQRQEGVNMVRIKLPGGRLSAPQLRAVAELVENYAEQDAAHITTRQDLQVHYVPLQHAPAALKLLASAGLTTREACGNTIRNMTACSLAGVCPKEHTDVTKHLDGAVLHFLRNPLNQQLPRKFKISFSGCEADCAQGMIHDLGVVAVKDGERFGFKVLAGGGLGHKPHEAVVVEPFIEEQDLIPVMEALVALHNRYSDRQKRAKARIKFLVDRFGPEGFVEKYREELARTRDALASEDSPRGEWQAGVPARTPGHGAPRELFAQKQPGRYVLSLSVPLGQLSAKQLKGLARLLDIHKLPELRVSQDQNVMIFHVSREALASIRTGAAALGLHEPEAGDSVVACPGTSTCRLGITSSTVVAPKLDGGQHDLRIRVSGCHNGCAQPETGDIGIYGEGRRLHGRLIPHYQVYLGGNGLGAGALALKGPSVPAARIESALIRVRERYAADRTAGENFPAWVRRKGVAWFNELLADLIKVEAHELESVLRDHGQGQDFKVLQLGGGECAGASQVSVGSAFFDAAHERTYRNAYLAQRKYADAAACAVNVLTLVGNGTAQILGGAAKDDLAGIASELARFPGSRALGAQLGEFLQVLALPEDDLAEPVLAPLFKQIDQWTRTAGDLCLTLNAQLDLAGALPPAQAPQRKLEVVNA